MGVAVGFAVGTGVGAFVDTPVGAAGTLTTDGCVYPELESPLAEVWQQHPAVRATNVTIAILSNADLKYFNKIPSHYYFTYYATGCIYKLHINNE
ncbi:hypothetical protein [Methanocella sp. MCL-LM]|uniref:hypothetical protein n=1 Tax=Methanocella sp. MCL-LM TaxID=3412035 RepID=UPI003C750E4C